MENEVIENEVFLQPQEDTYEYTQFEEDSILLLSNTNSLVNNIYNSILITTMLILSFSLYMFFHNITKRKEI